MSVTTQIIFPYMSDARAPAMDVHMTPQDAGMARSFWLILSALKPCTGFPWRVPPSSVRRRLSWWVPPDVVCGRVQACLLFVGASAVKALRD